MQRICLTNAELEILPIVSNTYIEDYKQKEPSNQKARKSKKKKATKADKKYSHI